MCKRISAERSFPQNFSPVVRYDLVRTLIALATEFNMHTQQFDVKTALLYGELKEQVLIKQPKGFETSIICL